MFFCFLYTHVYTYSHPHSQRWRMYSLCGVATFVYHIIESQLTFNVCAPVFVIFADDIHSHTLTRHFYIFTSWRKGFKSPRTRFENIPDTLARTNPTTNNLIYCSACSNCKQNHTHTRCRHVVLIVLQIKHYVQGKFEASVKKTTPCALIWKHFVVNKF